MPKGRQCQEEHVQRVGPKEQRLYEHILAESKAEHRHPGREEEVAARTVLRHLAEEGHEKGE